MTHQMIPLILHLRKVVPDQNHPDTVDMFLRKMHKIFYQVVSSDE